MNIIDVLRQLKIGPFAIFDIVISYVAIYFLAPLLTKAFHLIHIHISRTVWLWWTLLIAVLTHLLFRQDTPLQKMLFDPQQFFLPAVVLLVMVCMGAKRVWADRKTSLFSMNG